MAKSKSKSKSKPSSRSNFLLAVGLAWLIPGAGHAYLGDFRRGLILFIVISATFWAGVAMGGTMTVDSRYEKWWLLTQLMAGGHGLCGWYRQEQVYRGLENDPQVQALLTARQQEAQRTGRPIPPMQITPPADGRPDDLQMLVTAKLAAKNLDLNEPTAGFAMAFTGVAGMLNFLAAFDALMLALIRRQKKISSGGDA